MVTEEIGLAQMRKVLNAGVVLGVRWRLVNHAGAVIEYVLTSPDGLDELLEHIYKYNGRGCIEYSTHLPAYLVFDQDGLKEMIGLCRQYRDCGVGIRWDDKSYYEIAGYDRYSLEDDPEYFEDEDNKRYTAYILLLESDLFREAEYFYLNDDISGSY